MDTFPSAEVVARAIVAAAKETGADPEAIILGEVCKGGPQGNYAVSRARAYAAFALRTVHDDCGSQAIARMVGVRAKASIGTYMASLEFQRRQGGAKWWSDEVLQRVIAATKNDKPQKSKCLKESDYPALNTRRQPARNFQIVTSEVCGDPPIGRSALDKLRALT